MSNIFDATKVGGVNIFTYTNETDDVNSLISQALVDYYDKSQVDFFLDQKVDVNEFNDFKNDVDTSLNNLETNKLDIVAFDASWNSLGNEFVSKNGDTMNGDYNLIGDLFIDGSLNIMGGATTIQTQIVEISNNKITLNSNQQGTPPLTLQSGVIVNRGSETNYEFIFDESSNTFLIGEVGDLQPVATREDNPINNRIPYWDVNETRLKTDRDLVIDASGRIRQNAPSGSTYTLDIREPNQNTRVMINDCPTCITDMNASLNIFIDDVAKEFIHFRRRFQAGPNLQVKEAGISIDDDGSFTFGKYSQATGNYEELLYLDEDGDVRGNVFVEGGTKLEDKYLKLTGGMMNGNINMNGFNLTNASILATDELRDRNMAQDRLNFVWVLGDTNRQNWIRFRRAEGNAGCIFSNLSSNNYFLYNDGSLKINHNNTDIDGRPTGVGGNVLGTTIFNLSTTGTLNVPELQEGGTKLEDKYASISHTHPISDITNLQNELNLKADTSLLNDYILKTGGTFSPAGPPSLPPDFIVNFVGGGLRMDGIGTQQGVMLQMDGCAIDLIQGGRLLVDGVDKLAEIDASLNNRYTKTETDTLLNGKSNVGHTHPISDITNLQTELDSKVSLTGNQNIGGIKTFTGVSATGSDIGNYIDYINFGGTGRRVHFTKDPTGDKFYIMTTGGGAPDPDQHLILDRVGGGMRTNILGSLAIGKDTNPNVRLDVNGIIRGTELQEGTTKLEDKYALVGNSSKWTQSGNDIYNNNTGRVGVGNTSPSAKLDILSDLITGLKIAHTSAPGFHSPISLRMINSTGDGDWNITVATELLDDSKFVIHKQGQSLTTAPFRINQSNNVEIQNDLLINGDVGIGTTSPNAKLEVLSSSFISAIFKRTGSGGSGIRIINSSENGNWNVGVGSNNNFGIYQTGDGLTTGPFRINQSNNVEIQNDLLVGNELIIENNQFRKVRLIRPNQDTEFIFGTGGNKEGTIRMLEDNNVKCDIRMNVGNNEDIIFRTGGTNERMRILSNGIGNYFNRFDFQDVLRAGYIFDVSPGIQLSTNGIQTIGTDGSQLGNLILQHTLGNVGIGTSPSQKLDVNGNCRIQGFLTCDGLSANNQSISNVNVLNATALQDKDRTTNRLNYISINGTTNLQEWIRFRRGGGSPSGNAGCIFSNFSNNNFFLYNSEGQLRINFDNTNIDGRPTGVGANPLGTPIFTLTSSGRVGIRTTNPNSQLHINAVEGTITANFQSNSFVSNQELTTWRSNWVQDNRLVARVMTNGNLQNFNNSYGAISDIKLKKDIEDAKSQLEDIKQIRVVNFTFKEDDDSNRQIGVIAQEIEKVCPHLVEETNDTDGSGNIIGTTKSVKYSVLYMKNVKATQELIEKVERLEEENKELKSRLERLEKLLLSE